ncbi:putative permease [Wickerhamomyces ciferrii]|uniref:SAGA complex subunit Spt7 n=1 Tax=Wickerhamomyces ciferrii (strain ATCC 14091 / BCRC 22168 / CBS 111 / JCM 3599 / NBRC 0793 / NRRL Y-1031 F-60-10) TaxID=1206466 RepID=K0KIS0_WICCF|nr:putative permease [Wickerhamomyces ciferrii]CCH41053.1 putative permease [Wickerhamomyces ciferrii]
MTDKLKIFENNDLDKLYSIALKLWNQKIFDYYLTNQQLIILEQIFNNPYHSKDYFKAFLSSRIHLKFTKVDNNDGDTNDNDNNTPTTTSNDIGTPSMKKEDSIKQENNQDQQLESSLNESSLIDGVEPARSLSLKIRYILWEKAIDVYYNDGNIQEYEIFGEDDETDTKQLESKQQNVDIQEPKQTRDIDEDDDYDDEEEEEEEQKKEDQVITKDSPQEGEEIDLDDDGNIILLVPIATNDTSQLDNKILIDNFNKIYHNFENDRETLIKRRKLEENDKLLEDQSINNPTPNNNDKSNQSNNSFAINLGAANLSLKHLLQSIDQNKEKLNLQDNELRQLIMDVRKNRSKWASDDKIGQEELYEACEKVIMELRGYTEHSTAFLNKVSKREAPNYLQIIKKPMDLNTILKKLKNFQYKSKTEFVDDVMLIWKNCLTFNSDPKHFLRAHAIAMQKKSLTLIPLIPDITIKDRSEVEIENEDNSTPIPSSNKGKTTGSSKKGTKRTRSGEEKPKEETPLPTATADQQQSEVSTPLPQDSTKDNNQTTDASTTTLNQSNVSTPNPNAPITQGTQGTQGNTSTVQADTTELDDEEQDDQNSNEYLNQEDNDKDDLEIQTWKNLTAKTRANFCSKRSNLFENNKLNIENDAILRDSTKMSNFQSHLKNHVEIKNQSLNKSNNGRNQELDDLYLIEYDVTGGLPSIPYKGIDEDELDKQESKLIDKVLADGLKPSEFAPKNGGLNKIINENIEEMQEIRKICFKISLIRQMQQQQFVHHTQLKPPEFEKINDSIDLDPISRLDNHDKFNKDLIYFVMRKKISKIAMQNGFESTELFAIDTLTQIAGDFMDNLTKSIKTHLETSSANREQKSKNVLLLSLLQNGLNKPDDLHTYVVENVLKQNGKLKDLKLKLSQFLKSLLRPAMEMNEKNFNDNSDQFLSGDFSNEIGEDFFGFKELGLDKEFGMLGNSLPLHLLQSKFNESNTSDDLKKIHLEEFENAPFKRIQQDDIQQEIGIFQKFLNDCVTKTKHYHSKQLKSKKEVNEYLNTVKNVTIMDDEDYPKKQNKPKLPPTGKITPSKRKITPTTFFLPEEDEKKETDDTNQSSLNTIKEESNQDDYDQDVDDDSEFKIKSELNTSMNGGSPLMTGSLGLDSEL